MKYYLAQACENTFVLFDCLNQISIDENFLDIAYEFLHEEERDDALILTNGKNIGDAYFAEMIILGLDGELGEFCGNGARACAAYLFKQYPCFKRYYLVTQWGALQMQNHGEGIYSIKLPKPCFVLNSKFVIGTELFGLQYVEVMEPHLLFQGKMSNEELLALGRKLNQRKDIFPHGINVNSWHTLDKKDLYVKTYERGVQRLTRSCGTGSVACAAYFRSNGNVQVFTPGGNLEIDLKEEEIELKGPASFSHKGKKGRAG